MKKTDQLNKNLKKRKFSDLASDDEELKESFKKAKNSPKRVKVESVAHEDADMMIDTNSGNKVEKEEQKGNN